MTQAYVETSWLVDRRGGSEGTTFLPLEFSAVVTSTVTQVEVARTLRRDDPHAEVDLAVHESLLGVDALPVSERVVALACRLPVRHLKSLDAIHVASALITRCDIVLTRDRQMARACEELGLQVA